MDEIYLSGRVEKAALALADWDLDRTDRELADEAAWRVHELVRWQQQGLALPALPERLAQSVRQFQS